jgi:photosystem II stability/assembly factor-like uncharacterized protein
MILVSLVFAMLAACEAPLDLTAVESEKNRAITRFDMFQGAAYAAQRLVLVSSTGAALLSTDNGKNWQRFELPGRPSLIDVTSCSNGDFYALDSEKRVWAFTGESNTWISAVIETPESVLSIHCAPNNRLWVSASFSTLYWSDAGTNNWHEYSMGDDLQFTAVQFVDAQHGFAVGEFGTVISSQDGGDSWEVLPPIPNEFYPMAMVFSDAETGWVGGLNGAIWGTVDGAQSWQRQETDSSSPVYGLYASRSGVYAAGGGGKLVEFSAGKWGAMAGAPEVLAYLRALTTVGDQAVLAAGAGGTIALVPTSPYANSQASVKVDDN